MIVLALEFVYFVNSTVIAESRETVTPSVLRQYVNLQNFRSHDTFVIAGMSRIYALNRAVVVYDNLIIQQHGWYTWKESDACILKSKVHSSIPSMLLWTCAAMETQLSG